MSTLARTHKQGNRIL